MIRMVSDLRRIQTDLPRRIAELAAPAVLQRVRENAPVDTGALRDSIEVFAADNSIVVTADVYYAIYNYWIDVEDIKNVIVASARGL